MRELVIEMVQSHQSILIQKVTLDPLTSLLKEDYHYALEHHHPHWNQKHHQTNNTKDLISEAFCELVDKIISQRCIKS